MKKNEKKMKTFEKFFKCFKFLEKKLFSGRKNFHCQSFYYFVVLFFYSCIHVPMCCCVLHLLPRLGPLLLLFLQSKKYAFFLLLFCFFCFFFAKQKKQKRSKKAKKSLQRCGAPGVLAKFRRKQF